MMEDWYSKDQQRKLQVAETKSKIIHNKKEMSGSINESKEAANVVINRKECNMDTNKEAFSLEVMLNFKNEETSQKLPKQQYWFHWME